MNFDFSEDTSTFAFHLAHYLHRLHAHRADALQKVNHPFLVIGKAVGVKPFGNRLILWLRFLVKVRLSMKLRLVTNAMMPFLSILSIAQR
jgi:hypothetical protein